MVPFTESDMRRLRAQLRRDEGSRRDKHGNHVAYLDTAAPPVLTVGYGHNCAVSPVPGVTQPGDAVDDDVAEALFAADLDEHIRGVRHALPWTETLDPPRRAVLYNMAYNLGLRGFLRFTATLALVRAGEYEAAAERMLDSMWAAQVKGRAKRLAEQMKTGGWR